MPGWPGQNARRGWRALALLDHGRSDFLGRIDRDNQPPFSAEDLIGAGGLVGCEQMGSRPINHIHISARGRCILCCQDYSERWEVGDLTEQTLVEMYERLAA